MNKIGIFFLLLFLSLSTLCFSQTSSEDMWKQLSKVTFKKYYNEELEEEVMLPNFDNSILKLDGQTVEIEGYLIPIEMNDDYFALSAFPFAACFFCGAAGPETVMEIYLAKGEKISYTDKPIRIRGKLELNKNDINHLIFMLKNAKYLKK